jgi:hypothetical protein
MLPGLAGLLPRLCAEEVTPASFRSHRQGWVVKTPGVPRRSSHPRRLFRAVGGGGEAHKVVRRPISAGIRSWSTGVSHQGFSPRRGR